MVTPKISVIISTYNSERFIRGRLQNLVNQTLFSSIEVIIINSGSKQNEELIVNEFQNQFSNIHYIKTIDREPIYKAWNRGIAIAKGQYITNANTDDRLRPDALEILTKALDDNPGVGLVYANQFITSIENAEYEHCLQCPRTHRYSYTRLRLFAGYLPGSQPMWRSSLHFKDMIWFDEEYEVAGDYDFACRVAEKYKLLCIPDVIGTYYRSKTNENKEFQNIELTNNESFRIQEKYVQRYLHSLSKREFVKLYYTTLIMNIIPKWIYAILHRIIHVINRDKQILNKVFWCWMTSIIQEYRGNVEKAINTCKKYYNIRDAFIIRYRYSKLTGMIK